jgi:hypothetical protein
MCFAVTLSPSCSDTKRNGGVYDYKDAIGG